jgi:manganese transport protein
MAYIYNDKKGKRGRLQFGPGSFVTAAFIGPGTIATCSMAGAQFGYSLLWGLTFSVVATIVLQEMSARLGIVTQSGLGEALRRQSESRMVRIITAVLVISAIGIGNAAFETGNILGASLGLQALLPFSGINVKVVVLITGLLAFLLLYAGSYRVIEKVLITLVILMSITFITTAVIVAPQVKEILKSMFIPRIPGNSVIALVGLIGTTVVPYNLFLHASAVQEKWKDNDGLHTARLDIAVSVIIGGLISMAIVITSAVALHGTGREIAGASDLAVQLEPLLGRWAKYFLSAGLFAAGVSSAITAPLAAAYAVGGVMGWPRDLSSLRFRLVWIVILLTGMAFSASGFKPVDAIVFAQVANGILLPVIAIYLLWVMNSKKIMGDSANRIVSNIFGFIVVLVASGLGIRSLLHVFGIL